MKMYEIIGGEKNRATSLLWMDLLCTDEVGVCRESDICEERLLELKIPLTKLPRRRAVKCVCWVGDVKGIRVV